mmetsp:Transcript_20972/g.64118  ORF Transcript_20972/g.64118 Transcript_20972/m.64118 type:complete len:213 (+) Transcript_20972:2124-2762(+)
MAAGEDSHTGSRQIEWRRQLSVDRSCRCLRCHISFTMTVGFVARAHSRLIVDRHCCNSLDDKVIGSQRPCLIEAAEGELARQRDTERFGTEDIVPVQCQQRVVHRQRELHGQFGRHDRCDDHEAMEHQLVPRARRVGKAFMQHIARCCKREHEEEKYEYESLAVGARDALTREEDRAHQLTLGRIKAGLNDDADSTAAWRLHCFRLVSACVL